MVLGQSGWRGEVEDNWKVEGDGGQLERRRRWRTIGREKEVEDKCGNTAA